MSNLIERTLFWFSDGNEQLLSLNERYFALGTLLNRLLNEQYRGKKIEFINIHFRTEESYKLHPQAAKHFVHFYGGHLSYDDVFDRLIFDEMSDKNQDKFIWKRAYEVLRESAETIKNNSLFEASTYAYNQGISINLNPDYRMVEADIEVSGQLMKAAVWVCFMKDGMYAKVTLEQEGKIVFEKNIDKTKNGVEFFLEMYKGIELENDNILIKGRKDIDYLPLRIPLKEVLEDIAF